MKLELITLNNFRQFAGEHSIRFSCDPTKNVTVVCGVNGAGKTSLLIALSWCLYGHVYGHDIAGIGELVNKKSLLATKIGSSVETAVQVVFTHQGERYTAKRVLEASRISDTEWERDREPPPTLTRIRSDGQFETIQNPTGVIEFILPSSVSPYFFFDGEKIDLFTRPGHEEEVKSAVRQVLKIEVLERTRVHLGSTVREYQQELKKLLSGELQILVEKQGHLQEELTKQRDALDKYRGEQQAAESQFRQIDERLREIGASRTWSERRQGVSATLKAKEQQRDRVWEEIRGLANQSFVTLARPVLDKALAILDEKRERGEIPPGIREQFVQDLLTRKLCICGRAILEDSDEHRKLTRLLGESVSSDLENAVIQSAGDLRSAYASMADIPSKIKGTMREKANTDEEIESLNQQLDEISRHLQGFDHEEIENLERKREEYRIQLQTLAGSIGHVEERIERVRTEIDENAGEIGKAEIHEQRARRVQRRFALASKASEAVDKMCDTFASDMRHHIQEEAMQIFKALVWKDSQFRNVHISDDYSLEVFDRWGLPARRELSAGERQVLSLAFITGMARVTGEEAPLVMDTPFGRLSSSHRENIAQHIPGITKQLILLVTDEELHSQARRKLEARIGAEYELVFDQTTGCTSVKKVKQNVG